MVTGAKISTLYAPIDTGKAELDWPTRAELVECQTNARRGESNGLKIVVGFLQDGKGRTWIPNDRHMRITLLIAAHGEWNVHRSNTATLREINEHFVWDSIEEDTESFVASCIHCLTTDTWKRIPRPLGRALHGSRPNKVLHFDFCYKSKC